MHNFSKILVSIAALSGLTRAGLATTDERGVIYNLIADRWEISTDTDVNYMVLAERNAAA